MTSSILDLNSIHFQSCLSVHSNRHQHCAFAHLVTYYACSTGTPKKPATGADIKAIDPDQPHVAPLQLDMALDGQLQQFVMAPQGLFPAPLPLHHLADGKVLGHFKLLGRAMAKALQDNRLLDIPLSYVFYR